MQEVEMTHAAICAGYERDFSQALAQGYDLIEQGQSVGEWLRDAAYDKVGEPLFLKGMSLIEEGKYEAGVKSLLAFNLLAAKRYAEAMLLRDIDKGWNL